MSEELHPRGADFEASYDELRRVSSWYLRSSGPITLQTTSLVHEAYLKLAARPGLTLRGSAHMRALMARAMRQVLIDHVRRRNADKRGPASLLVSLEESGDRSFADVQQVEVELVDRAITELETDDPGSARVLELIYFGGYRQSEVAQILGVSDRTVRTRIRQALDSLREFLQRD